MSFQQTVLGHSQKNGGLSVAQVARMYALVFGKLKCTKSEMLKELQPVVGDVELTTGAYGTVYCPPIGSDDPSLVGKVFIRDVDFRHESRVAELVDDIDPEGKCHALMRSTDKALKAIIYTNVGCCLSSSSFTKIQHSVKSQVPREIDKLQQFIDRCHELGICHNDISDSNILFTYENGVLCLRFIDFGMTVIREETHVSETEDFSEFLKLPCSTAYVRWPTNRVLVQLMLYAFNATTKQKLFEWMRVAYSPELCKNIVDKYIAYMKLDHKGYMDALWEEICYADTYAFQMVKDKYIIPE